MNETSKTAVQLGIQQKIAPRRGRDVVVTPWAGGFAAIRVGGKRPGRVRDTQEMAIRDGRAMARVERSRLFVSTVLADYGKIAELSANGALADETVGFGEPVADLRAVLSRRDDGYRDSLAAPSAPAPRPHWTRR